MTLRMDGPVSLRIWMVHEALIALQVIRAARTSALPGGGERAHGDKLAPVLGTNMYWAGSGTATSVCLLGALPGYVGSIKAYGGSVPTALYIK